MLIFAATMRETSITALRENHIGIFKTTFHELGANKAFDMPNRERFARAIDKAFIGSGAMAGNEVPSRLNHFIGALGYGLNTFNFEGIFSQKGFIKECAACFAHKLI